MGLLATLAAIAAFNLHLVRCTTTEHQYCIVGAGPAGIQLGHFLKHAGRDYVIYERSDGAGSFFRHYPRHRALISLNKRYVREGRSEEFAFRHDWNSLIDVRTPGNRTRPVTQRSKLLFPHADVLPQYFGDFAEEQVAHIRYGIAVTNVRRLAGRSGFEVALQPASGGASSPASAELVHCREVVVATGLFRPRGALSRVDGAELVEGYEQLPATGEAFEGKSVVVLGLGNAALETAQELQKHTAELHLFARARPLPEGGSGARFAYQTHYVGDIRAGRTTILDTYLLKSLDTFDFNALGGARRLVVLECQGKRRCVWQVETDDCSDQECRDKHMFGGQNLSYRLPVAMWERGSPVGQRIRKLLKQHVPDDEGAGWTIEEKSLLEDQSEDQNENASEELALQRVKARQSMGIDDKVFSGQFDELVVTSTVLRAHRALLDALAPLRARSNMENIRYPMDHVIRCFGWAMDTSIFDSSVPLNTTHHGKYPQLLPTFEAVGVPGLHFAGTLAHGLDFRKSAGGFIHGFRYTARALFRLLEEQNFGVPWPSTTLPLKQKAGMAPWAVRLAKALQHRINEASGPYQMFGALGDVVLFEREPAGGDWAARYLEELPLAHAHAKFRHLPRLTWVYRYGEGFHGPEVLGTRRVGSTSSITAEKSNFLHPHVTFYPAGEAEPSMKHWIFEDIFTQWDADEVYSPLVRFVMRALVAVTGDPSLAEVGVFEPEPPESEACDPHDARQ